jgi:hypothetical protein
MIHDYDSTGFDRRVESPASLITQRLVTVNLERHGQVLTPLPR